MIRSVFKGCGSYLPEKIVTNHDLAERVETSHDWIVKRTGIEQRHVAAEGETTLDMAEAAAKQALEHAGLKADDIDTIIIATTTPDKTFPSTAVQLQGRLGITHGYGFDVQAVCSGFVYALSVADGLIKAGRSKNTLVIGAEKMSAILDWDDRGTCILFGDGAGAVILSAEEGEVERGIVSCHLHCNGAHQDLLYTSGGTATTGNSGVIHMEGQEVFKHAVTYLSDIVDETLEANNLKPSDIDWLVPHQANIRIIEGTAKKLDMSMDRVVTTIHKHGNTSAASIPLALNEAVRDGRIKPGELILFEALGGGFTWGSALMRL